MLSELFTQYQNRINLFQRDILGEMLLPEKEIKEEALECISCVGENKESIMKINCTLFKLLFHLKHTVYAMSFFRQRERK